MTRIASLLVIAAVAIPIAACDTTGEQAMVQGGAMYSMDAENGRFHKVHTADQGLACESCHGGTEYRADFVTLSKYDGNGGGSPGIVDRAACLGCHKAGGMATAWYGGRANK